MLLLVDNGSVFTKNIVDFLDSAKTDHAALPFDKLQLADLSNFDSIILSGRRHNDQKMNALNSKIINHCIAQSKPMLGICYGAEILALTVGGTIRKMSSIQKGPITIRTTQQNPLCSGIIQVYQSHNYEISTLGKSLIQLAHSDSCKYEIIQYKNSKIYGTQFHPEMTQDGLSLIEKFIRL
ncbi:MAG: glutamine amidotransferase [Thaumarchaeota archaeon]|nr:glutamine amidotransferase [Nitrososphaerota archaeon]